ncbi:DinB family protein [Oryzihumus sp.]|uniref:DinB family protein n=1 Tax=Oryzihumus sp. TaxID=1968903 RepID=UPI002ED973FB
MPGSVRPITDERDGLLAYLAQMRYVLRLTAHGLSDEQARATPTASSLSVGGLVKHAATTERGWIQRVRDVPQTYGREDYLANFHLAEGETLQDVLDLYEEVAAETETAIAEVEDLGRPVPVPRDAPWFPQDVEAWSVRWVLLHLIQETARHAGHADIVRESIDGATAFPLMAAAEGWPETPWMKPWTPPVEAGR